MPTPDNCAWCPDDQPRHNATTSRTSKYGTLNLCAEHAAQYDVEAIARRNQRQPFTAAFHNIWKRLGVGQP